MMPLDLLANGQQACIADVSGNPQVVVRLREIGIEPGAMVTMVRRGSPCIIAVDKSSVHIPG